MARLLSFAELKSLKGLTFTRSYVRRMEKAGRFPKRIRLTAQTVAWDEGEVDAWIGTKKKARDVPPPAPIPLHRAS